MQPHRNLCISIPNDPTPGDSSALPLIHLPKTQASGPGPQHSHLRTAPPRRRGYGPLPRGPRSQPRCPRMRRSCPARRAPSDRRAGQGALESGRVQPHFHPLLPCGAGGGVSTQAQSQLAEAAAWGTEWKEGWVREAARLVSKRRATGRRTAGKGRGLRGLRWLTGVKNVPPGRRCA